MRFGILIDSCFADHENPPGHPESSERIVAIEKAINGWSRRDQLIGCEPVRIDDQWLRQVHSREHLERIRRTKGREIAQLDPDTFTSPRSYEVALLAAGGCVDMARRVLDREIDSGFALVRPPGHHAESWRAMGFCLFNNAALAAEYSLSRPDVDRVAIVDFDVHHGNGIQEIFYARSDVLYISSHQYPLYPGTGSWRETGEKGGLGYTVNFPVAAGAGNSFFEALFDDMIVPILGQYHPDLIIVSAGYDAHRDDPLAGLTMTESGFRHISEQLNRAADDICSGKIFYVLEGGYNLPALCNSILETVEARLEPRRNTSRSMPPSYYKHYRDQAVRCYKDYWSLEPPE